jgi:hypothetical protein
MNTQAYYPITREQLQLKEDTTELTKMILEERRRESSSIYISGILKKICDDIIDILFATIDNKSKEQKYVYYFSEFENNYVLKVIKDELKVRFPGCVYELDSEKKFVSIDWS